MLVRKQNPYKKKLSGIYPNKTQAALAIQKKWRTKKQTRFSPSVPIKTIQIGYNWGSDYTYINSPFVYQVPFPRATVDVTNTSITNLSRTSDTIWVSGLKFFLQFHQNTLRKVHIDIALLECKGLDTDYNNYNTAFFQDHYSPIQNSVDFPLSPGSTYDSQIMQRPINPDKFNVIFRKKFLLESQKTGTYNNTGAALSYINRDSNSENWKRLDVWVPVKRRIDFYNGQGYYPRRNYILVWWPTALTPWDFTDIQTLDEVIYTDIRSVVYFKNI